MYIVAIAWMYVVVLMAAAQDSMLAGLGTLVFYGLLPCGVLMYLLAAPRRAKLRRDSETNKMRELAQQADIVNDPAAPPALQTALKAG